MQTDTVALDNLHALEALLKKGHRSKLVETALNKLVALELAGTKTELRGIEARIGEFEEKYGMSSESFENRFHAGLTNDSADSMEWISFIDMKKAILQRIQILQDKRG